MPARLVLLLAAAAFAAGHRHAHAAAAGVYQGKGYYFYLPQSGSETYRAKLEPGDGGEQVYVYPPSLSAEKLAELGPGEYGAAGVIKLEVVRPDEGEKVTLKSLEQQTVDDFQGSGAKVTTTDLKVLAMPGFYANVAGTEKFAIFVLQGKQAFYYVTSGPKDAHALGVVKSLAEGKAPPAKPSKAAGPADPFGGRRLGSTKGGFAPSGSYGGKDYSQSNGFAKPNGYAPKDNYAK